MRYIHRKKTALAGFCVMVLSSVILLAFINTDNSSSQASGGDCIGTSLTAHTTGSEISTTLYGLSEVDIALPTSDVTQVGSITIFANNQRIGRAQPAGMNLWNFKWATSLWPSGMVNLSAKVFYPDHSCLVRATYPINVINNQLTILDAIATPNSWEGLINSSNQVFIVKSVLVPNPLSSFDPSPYSIYEWSMMFPNIGNIFIPTNTFLDNTKVSFSSGQTPGDNILSTKIIYGGGQKTINIPIKVNSPPTAQKTEVSGGATPTSTPTVTAKPTATTTPIPTPTSLTTATQITSSQLQVSPITQNCIENELTAERYITIDNGTTRPTASELTKIADCFATSKYVLPSNFSPIDPSNIKNLEVENTTSVNKLENITKKYSSGDKQTLKITGKAKANSIVIVYVYSDPLVITTSTDGDGNWQYTLEDPLEPGSHEVYAIVDKGDGLYKRSDPLAFFISTAGASANNPNGLSLKLGEPPTSTPTQSKNGLIFYIVGSIAALAVALTGLFIIIKVRNKRRASKESTTPIIDSAPVASANSTPIAPVQETTPAVPNTNTTNYAAVNEGVETNIEQPTFNTESKPTESPESPKSSVSSEPSEYSNPQTEYHENNNEGQLEQ